MLQLSKMSNTYCLLKSIQFKQKNYEDLKISLESPINDVSSQTNILKNKLEKIINKIDLNEQSIDQINILNNEIVKMKDKLESYKSSINLYNNNITKENNKNLMTINGNINKLSETFETKLIKSNENFTRQLLFNEENIMLTIKLLEEKLFNLENKKNISDLINIDQIMKLKIFPKTTSILVSNNNNKPFEYFQEENKLYQNNNIGNNYSLVNGYYFIAISNNQDIIKKAWNVQNGEMIELTSYFDGSNNKLIIDSNEYVLEGSIILTSDFKIWVRINNCWISK